MPFIVLAYMVLLHIWGYSIAYGLFGFLGLLGVLVFPVIGPAAMALYIAYVGGSLWLPYPVGFIVGICLCIITILDDEVWRWVSLCALAASLVILGTQYGIPGVHAWKTVLDHSVTTAPANAARGAPDDILQIVRNHATQVDEYIKVHRFDQCVSFVRGDGSAPIINRESEQGAQAAIVRIARSSGQQPDPSFDPIKAKEIRNSVWATVFPLYGLTGASDWQRLSVATAPAEQQKFCELWDAYYDIILNKLSREDAVMLGRLWISGWGSGR